MAEEAVVEREPTGSEDRSADIEAAIDQLADTDAPARPDAPEADAPARDTGAAAEGRDALGRFAPKRTSAPDSTTAAPALDAPAPTTTAVDPAAPAPDAAAPVRHAKPPQSWNPQEAAHWDKTPAEVREAVMRREVEVNRALQDSASARNGLQQLQSTIAPYIPNVNAANGGDVVGAIRTFFDYDNRMRHGTQIEKAKAVSALIRGYGIDIGTLDSELAGQQHDPQQVNQSAIQEALARELAPMREYMNRQQQMEQQQYQQTITQIDQGVAAFAADPKNVHYDTVRDSMADLLELAGKRGHALTMAQAYEQACLLNPATRSSVLAQQAAVANPNQAAQRAKAAAVGVKNAPRAGAPAVTTAPEKRHRVDDVRAAFDAHTGATE
jgi:hypothetical protein